MGTITKGYIAKEDMNLWGGTASRTFSRATSGGSTATLTKVGDVVDVLAVYGGTADDTTLQAAISAVGTATCAFLISPQAWTIAANLTFPATVTLIFPAGASFSNAASTVTIAGPVLADSRQIFTGAGTYTVSSYPQNDAWFGNAAATILTTGSTAIKIAHSGLVTTAGDIIYFNGTNLVRLAKGTTNQYLKTGTAPSWDTPLSATAFILTLMDDADAATARATLDAEQLWSVVAKTDNYNVLTTDDRTTFTMTAATTKTFTLPSVAAGNIGLMYRFVKLGAGQVTIDAADSDTIADSGAGDTIYCDDTGYATITLVLATATAWQIVAGQGSWTTTD